ncbi:sugar ABC transporter permease, partial [Streptomyces sp. NPDC055144]
MTATTQVPATAAAPPREADSSRRKAQRAAKRRRGGAAGVLMAPFFVLLTLVFLIPVCTAVWLSFFSDDQPGLGFGPERTVFVGLRSYAAVLTDPSFLSG